MKIVKLTTAEVKNAVAQVFSKKFNNNKVYMTFSIKHGTSGDEFGYWLLPIAHNIARPQNRYESKELDDNKYILIKRTQSNANGDESITDKLGNFTYTLSTDESTLHQKDVIVLWDIPNKKYTDVSYSTSGDVDLLGTGFNGKVRNNVIYKSPAPVLEVFGDCKMNWRAIDHKGNEYHQAIAYDYSSGKWDISPITKIEKDVS